MKYFHYEINNFPLFRLVVNMSEIYFHYEINNFTIFRLVINMSEILEVRWKYISYEVYGCNVGELQEFLTSMVPAKDLRFLLLICFSTSVNKYKFPFFKIRIFKVDFFWEIKLQQQLHYMARYNRFREIFCFILFKN